MNPEDIDSIRLERKLRRRERDLADDGFYFTDVALAKLRNSGAPRVSMPLRTEFAGDIPSDFFRVELMWDVFWCDVQTGTLYRKDGTSPAGGRMQILVDQPCTPGRREQPGEMP